MKILAIESSCDETAVAVLDCRGELNKPHFEILSNIVASQAKIHAPWGGVVPNLAKREHLKNLPILFKKIQDSGVKIQDFDLIAVTVGPGLEPALWTGINFAKELAKKWKKPIIGASHLDGHLYSFLLQRKRVNLQKIFPAIALIVSGGHTTLLLLKDLTHFKKIGETRDDAAGEAFDKAARLLDLPYPGGPEIEKSAKFGNPQAIDFPRPMLNQKNYDFSFSGLKTAVLYYLRDNKNAKKEDIAASFQQAAFDVLVLKTLRAAKEFKAKSIFVSGGVAANKTLKKEFQKAINNLKPDLYITKYPTDNAAMIASAAYINYLRGKNRRLIAKGDLGM